MKIDSKNTDIHGVTGVSCTNKKTDINNTAIITPFYVYFYQTTYFEPFYQISGRLLQLELRSCHLHNGNILENCTQLWFACLADNLITTVPLCIQTLTSLKFLDLSHNLITEESGIQQLENALPTLEYLNLSGNRVTKLTKYRSIVFGLHSALVALDKHIVSDEEILPGWGKFSGSRFAACSKYLYVHKYFRVCHKRDSVESLRRVLTYQSHTLFHIRQMFSPVRIIQRSLRSWMRYVRIEKYHLCISKFQARVRRFLLNRRVAAEMQIIVREADDTYASEIEVLRLNLMTPMVAVIQVHWRVYTARKKRERAARRIQWWFRMVITVHNGVCRWFRCHRITGLVFPSSHCDLVTKSLVLLANESTPGLKKRVENVIRGMRALQRIRCVRERPMWSSTADPHERHLVCLKAHPRHCMGHIDENEMNDEDSVSITEEMRSAIGSPVKPRMTILRAVPLAAICYATESQRKLLYILKPRGRHMLQYLKQWEVHSPPKRIRFRFESNKGYNHFWKRSSGMLVLHFGIDISFMWKIYKYLRRSTASLLATKGGMHWPNLPILYDTEVLESSAAIEIQRIWRGHHIRRAQSGPIIGALLRRRAAIAIQRCWRLSNGLCRRLCLLRLISQVCRGITSNTLYMDAWVYYRLLRCHSRPYNHRILRVFPEYCGIPLFNKDGRLVYQPLQLSPLYQEPIDGTSTQAPPSRPRNPPFLRRNCHMRKTVPVRDLPKEEVAMCYMRQCIPMWASWRPHTQNSPLRSSPMSYHDIIFSLIGSHCEVTVAHFPVRTASPQSHSTHEFRVMQLTFASTAEARTRCAMLMLQTYDPKSRSSLRMMTKECVLDSIRYRREDILGGPYLTKPDTAELLDSPRYCCVVSAIKGQIPQRSHVSNESAVVPLEARVILTTDNVDWLFAHYTSITAKDTIRFRFLCESLSTRNSGRTGAGHSERNAEGEESRGTQRPRIGEVPECSPRAQVQVRNDGVNHAVRQRQEYVQTVTQLTTARLRPAVERRSVSPTQSDRPKSKGAGAVDERLQRHLWNADRVLRWCAQFTDDIQNGDELGNAENTAVSRLEIIRLSQYDHTRQTEYQVPPKPASYAPVTFRRRPQSAGAILSASSRSQSPDEQQSLTPRVFHPKELLQMSKQAAATLLKQEKLKKTKEAHETKERDLEVKLENRAKKKREEETRATTVGEWREKRVDRCQKDAAKEKMDSQKVIQEKNEELFRAAVETVNQSKREKKVMRSKLSTRRVAGETAALLGALGRHSARIEQKQRSKSAHDHRRARVSALRNAIPSSGSQGTVRAQLVCPSPPQPPSVKYKKLLSRIQSEAVNTVDTTSAPDSNYQYLHNHINSNGDYVLETSSSHTVHSIQFPAVAPQPETPYHLQKSDPDFNMDCEAVKDSHVSESDEHCAKKSTTSRRELAVVVAEVAETSLVTTGTSAIDLDSVDSFNCVSPKHRGPKSPNKLREGLLRSRMNFRKKNLS